MCCVPVFQRRAAQKPLEGELNARMDELAALRASEFTRGHTAAAALLSSIPHVNLDSGVD